MQIETIVYTILSVILAIVIAGFQYIKTRKSISNLDVLFLFLRFITILSVLLLLVNPKFEQVSLHVEKPKLAVVVDNSSSVKYLNQNENALELVRDLNLNKELNDKFDVSIYNFGEKLKLGDSITFTDKQTNLSNALTQLSQLQKGSNAATILISDGNQTYGNDYEFLNASKNQPVYPIVLGDTVKYIDLKINQLNVNRYAYLKNKFPIEVIIVYEGNETVNSMFTITSGNTVIYSKPITLSQTDNSIVLNFNLPANRIGIHNYLAKIAPLESEKNKINNEKNFAIEVINQKTKIAIVSDFIHPDLGALKKSIESNEQRSVEFLNPKNKNIKVDDFQLFILYQQNNNFKNLINKLNKRNKNTFNIIGTKTDLDFINDSSSHYSLEITNQTEMYQGVFNSNYIPFNIEDIRFNTFPPLNSAYGSIIFNVPYQTILYRSINGISTNDPLLSTFEVDGKREAVLFGENIWQWRARSYLNHDSFDEFDNIIGKIIQYLSTEKQKNRLTIHYDAFYNGGTNMLLRAEFFDKNYVFDTRESLNISVIDEKTQESTSFPLILKNNYYEADLSNLKPSNYKFTVRSTNENISESGAFTILEFDVENQFVNANINKLNRLAKNTNGKSFLISKTDSLIPTLMTNSRYVAIQKSHKNSLPLVDWKYLLAIIVLSLSTEWFLRKYNGLI